MTTRSPAALSAQASAARMKRIKADIEFYGSLEYDRSRYSEDIAVGARTFLIAIRNALRTDPVDIEALSNDFGAEELPPHTQSPTGTAKGDHGGSGNAPAGARTSAGAGKAAGSSAADRRKDAAAAGTPHPETTSRGTKRPAASAVAAAASGGRNASSQKHKKPKRSPSTSNPGSSAGDGSTTGNGNGGGSDGSNGKNATAAGGAGHGNGGGNTSIPPRSDVACRVKEDGKASWILAKVSRYVSEAKKYEVMDTGDDEKLKTHLVFKKHIRVLPKKPLDFQSDERVLAVYPDTTVFYPAVVKGRRGKHIHCLFDDEEDTKNPTKEVDARFVIRLDGC